ncbi:putative transcriptional regulator [Plesiocystis pacifica SIR-1]|uniref:Putative transcriptional regulator n=1 Tax=Plesiocystis pacifica SIR-1 TaxID=391625 RepID=A6G186_9BACT|nr:AraC family transcriptional regulator [Plesiocystis pacifica]EDM80381.1 putative transcriptional regulator [Plesiocystis pacifica SIR-1]
MSLGQLLDDEYGIAAGELFGPLGWTLDALATPSARLTAAQAGELLARAVELTKDPGLGIRLGARAPVPILGLMGFALMTSATLGDALRQLVELLPAQSDAFRLDFVSGEGQATLYLSVPGDFGRCQDIALVASIVGVQGVASHLTGRVVPIVGELAVAAPEGWREVGLPEGMRCTFDAPEHRVVFRTEDLERPVVSAEPVANRLIVGQVREQLARLPEGQSLAERSRRLLEDEPRLRSAAQLARALGVSERALRRRLAEAGTSFREQRDAALRRRAIALLEQPEISLSDIAERLGFADSPSFSRAFARWVGEPPGRFRKRRNP